MSTNVDQLVQITKETIVLSAQEILGENAAPIIQRIHSAPDTPAGLREAVESCKNFTKTNMTNEGGEAIDVICDALLRDMDDAVRAADAKKTSSPEREALKARITKAKLIAAASSLLGPKANAIVQLLQSAQTSSDSIRSTYEQCIVLAKSTLPADLVALLEERCGRIVQQL